ncbi:MAG: [NiFe]-hydrogenase assembly chaperone HybE [Oceanobacter sp.]
MTAHLIAQIEAFYRDAAGRMRDLPLFNPALEVELRGWRIIQDGEGACSGSGHGSGAGVLITPWAVNLLALPGSEQNGFQTGDLWTLELPGGCFELTLARNEALASGVGSDWYATASLVSMTGQFTDMTEARSFADEIMALIWTPEVQANAQPEAEVPDLKDKALEQKVQDEKLQDEKVIPKKHSRRGFLGALMGRSLDNAETAEKSL